jgi:hypothetical protein
VPEGRDIATDVLSAIAQTIIPVSSHRKHSFAGAPTASIVLDIGSGNGKVEIQCAQDESTRECIEAAMPLFEIMSPVGEPDINVVFATNSINPRFPG